MFPKLIHSTLTLLQAKSLLERVKKYNFPLLQSRHRLASNPLSLRLSRAQHTLSKDQSKSKKSKNPGLLNSFIALHSDEEITIDLSNLFCTRIQKTMDAAGRLESQEDEMETLLRIMMTLEEHCRFTGYEEEWWLYQA